MSANELTLAGADSALALSPAQFHARLEAALRATIDAGARDGGSEGPELRVLAHLLDRAPVFVPDETLPAFVPALLVGGVRRTIARRREEAAAGSERLLEDLMEFVLSFYPQAAPPPPPPLWSEPAPGPL